MKRFHHKFTLPAILTLLVVAVAALLIGFSNFKKNRQLYRQIQIPVQSGLN